MTRGEVDEKCYDLIAPVLGSTRAHKLCNAVWHLEKVSDARALRPLLRREAGVERFDRFERLQRLEPLNVVNGVASCSATKCDCKTWPQAAVKKAKPIQPDLFS